MRTRYFIQQYSQKEYHHGGVGLVDAEKVILANGFIPILFPAQNSFSFKSKLFRLLFLVRMIFTISSDSVVFFIFPVHATMNKMLLWFLRLKGAKLLCLIADLEGLRNGNDILLQSEIRQLKRVKYFIVHNAIMGNYLKTHIPDILHSSITFFDYLVSVVVGQRNKKFNVVFAGNLQKSEFLSLLPQVALKCPLIHFNIYGSGLAKTIEPVKNISYKGPTPPSDLPLVLEGSFGLVWDGISIDTCAGSYGEYLRYNSQHKLSLYIISSLPVIVWEHAATADIVIKSGIGFTVKNLYEIENRINDLSDTEYLQMQLNMRAFAQRIAEGKNLTTAVEEILRLLDEDHG